MDLPIVNSTLVQVASTYGTPVYVYSADKIRRQYQSLHDYLNWPSLKILYAMKANYNPTVLSLLKNLGSWIDAVSPGDVLLAKRIGFKTKEILYTANNITSDEMKAVHSEGVMFNIGSLSELERYGQFFPGEEICLRFNPDIVAGAHHKIQTGGSLTKFGILITDFDQVKKVIERYNLKVVGLHKHTGSGIKDADNFMAAVENILTLAKPENFPNLKFIDFGGGFAVPYQPGEEAIDYKSFGTCLTKRFRSFCDSYGKELALYFEPGKYMLAESGILLVRINTLKNNRNRLIAGTDSGFPQLIRPVFYDAYHHITNLSNIDGQAELYDVCGNICETGDNFATQRKLPELREGDLLAIHNAGAYCYAMGGVYNLRPMPPEILVDGSHVSCIRKGLSSLELIEQILKESI